MLEGVGINGAGRTDTLLHMRMNKNLNWMVRFNLSDITRSEEKVAGKNGLHIKNQFK